MVDLGLRMEDQQRRRLSREAAEADAEAEAEAHRAGQTEASIVEYLCASSLALALTIDLANDLGLSQRSPSPLEEIARGFCEISEGAVRQLAKIRGVGL
jgi:hypothetical protein